MYVGVFCSHCCIVKEYALRILSVFVALGIQHAVGMRHIFICDLPGSTIFLNIISQTVRFSKDVI